MLLEERAAEWGSSGQVCPLQHKEGRVLQGGGSVGLSAWQGAEPASLESSEHSDDRFPFIFKARNKVTIIHMKFVNQMFLCHLCRVQWWLETVVSCTCFAFPRIVNEACFNHITFWVWLLSHSKIHLRSACGVGRLSCSFLFAARHCLNVL